MKPLSPNQPAEPPSPLPSHTSSSPELAAPVEGDSKTPALTFTGGEAGAGLGSMQTTGTTFLTGEITHSSTPPNERQASPNNPSPSHHLETPSSSSSPHPNLNPTITVTSSTSSPNDPPNKMNNNTAYEAEILPNSAKKAGSTGPFASDTGQSSRRSPQPLQLHQSNSLDPPLSTSSSDGSSGWALESPRIDHDAEEVVRARIKGWVSANGSEALGNVHEVMASATVTSPWDGNFPGEKLPRKPLTVGSQVKVCNIVDSNWYIAHTKHGCKYVPAMFLQIDSYTRQQYREVFAKRAELPGDATMLPIIPDSPTKSRRLLSFLRSCFRPSVDSPRPPLPPAPFGMEPHDKQYTEGRILVQPSCRPLKDRNAVVVTFDFQFQPASHTRFAGLRFNATLPDGQKVIALRPKEVSTKGSKAKHHASKQGQVGVNLSVQHTYAGLQAEYTHAKSSDVSFIRKTKASIEGSGVNTRTASWGAKEDTNSRDGLDHRIQFKILLPTTLPPQEIVCDYELLAKKERNLNETDEGSKLKDSWKISFG